ncbi:class I adenylate-forming enzyme family protein [Paenibacillus sp. YIM B09110]|uniref:class I adenylate-forming enzyme family protein n=1 Tax=Paenibacillus sp. YIM B09110 TaxID=3126102 RepID=UPI00301E57F7
MLLSNILPQVAQILPTHYAMKQGDTTITYEQLIHQVSCVAYGYSKLPIKPGDRIVLLGHPSPYLAIAEIAAIAIGAIPVAIFPDLTSKEMNQIVQDAAPAAIVYDSAHTGVYDYISSRPQAAVIALKSGAAGESIAFFIATLPPLTEWHQADPENIALIIYTGGTTGRSKGVMHSHRGIAQWAFMNPARGGGHNSAKKSLVPNQAHLTGQFILWTTLYEGGCLIYPESYPLHAEAVVELVEREQIKFLGTVGLLFRDIVYLENIASRQMQCVEGISCGGAPISVKTLLKARDVFPNAQITEVYSQTESGQFISSLSISQCLAEGNLERLLSVGNPSHLAYWGQHPYELRIVDDAGNEIEQGEIGEIICRGEQMMIGYWSNTAETDKAIRDGWLYTGDIGRFDEDGYLYVLDRKKDMVIVNGSNVYASEVEEAIGKHPSVMEAAVVGIALPDEGEEVVAVVTLREEALLTLDEVRQFCLHELALFKQPTRLEIAESLPRTSVGKPDKAALRRLYGK